MDGIWRQLTEAADEPAIPIDLVSIVHALEQHGHVWRFTNCGLHMNMAAVPGITNVGRVGLRTPGLISSKPLPSVVSFSVVKGRRTVRRIVAEVELP